MVAMYKAYGVSEVLPAAVFSAAVFLSAFPAYLIVRRAKRGRARSSIAYLAGFLLGLGATAGISLAMAPLLAGIPLFKAGVAGAFLGPFTGIVHAKLRRPARRRARWAGT